MREDGYAWTRSRAARLATSGKEISMSAPFTRSRTITERVRPRISVNKLGEYLVAKSAARRRQIIRDQKRPPDFKVVRYKDAQRAIVDYFSRGYDPAALSEHLGRLSSWAPGPDDSSYEAQRNRDCQDAIESFMGMLGFPDLINLVEGGSTMTPGPTDAPKLNKAGVAISVRPEFIVHGTDRAGVAFVGALKLHNCKGFALTQQGGEYVGTVLHEYAELHLAGRARCDHRHCHVLDVFARQLYSAPKSFKQRRSDIEAACEEIAAVWPTL
jgi:hypothetical protein